MAIGAFIPRNYARRPPPDCVGLWLFTFQDETLDGLATDLVEELLRKGRPDTAQWLLEHEAPAWLNCLQFPLPEIDDAVTTFLERAMVTPIDAVIAAEQGVIGAVTRGTQTVTARVDTVTGTIRADVAETEARLTQRINAVGDDVQTAVRDGLADVGTDVEAIVQDALGPIPDGIADIQRDLDALDTLIRDGIADTINGLETVITGVGRAVTDAIGITATAIDAVTGAVAGLGADLGSALGRALQGAIRTLLDAFGVDTQAFGGFVNAAVARLRDFVESDPADAMHEEAQRILRSALDADPTFEADMPTAALAGVSSFLGRIVAGYMLATGPLRGWGQAIGTVMAARHAQTFGRQFPFSLPGPGDLITMLRHGVKARDVVIDALRRQGFSETDSVALLDASRQPLPEADLLSFWRRGFVEESVVDRDLEARGYDETARAALKAAADLLPPVSDLITMAVREVFTPAVAERFGQFEDFPPVFAEFAKQLGLTEEWARRYWAAHWALPSPQQGFEMLHRGVIDRPDLDLLLRSLDVMPFWRDALTKIAFAPFTRVDIRRMHAMGILDRPAVVKAHRDIGYDEEKAELLTQFVEQLNAGTGGEDDDELGRLTRASILAFYKDGLLDRDRAARLLVDAKHTAAAAALYLDSVDFDVEREERKSEIDVIVANAESGAMTFDEASDRLNQLGLETAEVARAMTRLLRAERTKTRLPTRAEAETLLSRDAITEDQYRDLLTRLGYPLVWVEAFLKSAKGGARVSDE